jgi:OmpA-OmpF porin, OOP family
MRSRIAVVACAAASAVAFTAATLRAMDCSGPISPCINDDTLWPHAGPARFVAVGAARTVASGQIGFGLVTSYLSRPIVLVLVSPGPNQDTKANAVNDQVNGTFLWSYGVTDRLELVLALPLTFGQGGTGLAPVTGGAGLKDTAVRDLRYGIAYAVVPHLRVAADAPSRSTLADDPWGLVARLEVSAPTGDQDRFAGERSGVFVPSVAGDYRRGAFFAGAEVGARVRPTTELLGARIGTQLVAAAGVGYDLLPRELLSAAVEMWALPTFAGHGTVTTPAEWQLSARSAPLRGGDLSIELGGGGGIPFAPELPLTTPRFRFTLGLRWAPVYK